MAFLIREQAARMESLRAASAGQQASLGSGTSPNPCMWERPHVLEIHYAGEVGVGALLLVSP